jgi:MoxR-like ATPase
MMSQPYGWFVLDEMDAALPGVLLVLQRMLEKQGKLVLEDAASTLVERAPGFMFFATGNSIGVAGRHRLMYVGTNRMNEATIDRFDVVIHVIEMTAKLEEEVVARNAPDLDRDFVKAIIRIAKEVREQLADDQLSCSFSTRRCIQWAQAMCRFHPLRAARMTVLNKLSAEDGKVLEGVIQRYFGEP